MLPLRFLFVLSALGFLTALLSSGCASAPQAQVITPTEVQIKVSPREKQVRLVGKTPSREHYAFVAKIRVVARDDEFVRAARAAQQQLRDQARTLGADVVKIEIVSPDERAHVVVLAGRAYRTLN